MAGNHGWKRLTGRTLLSLPLLLFPSGAAFCQGTLLEARVEVSLPQAREPIRVLSVFSLRPERGTEEVPLSVLTTEPTRLVSLQALFENQELEPSGGSAWAVRLEEVRNHYWEGSIRLPQPLGEGGDSIVLQLSYVVEGAWDEHGKATIPLLVPRWVPNNPTPLTFLARVAVPTGLTVTGSFPTSVLNKPPPGEAGTYEMALQGVPAMLILRTAEGRTRFLSLEKGLDLAVVLILLVMGAFGVRYLRRRRS